MAKEIWNDIGGYVGLYQVSSFGRIRRFGKILKPKINRCGYYEICLCKKSKKTSKRVNRIVAISFLGDQGLAKQVNHKDLNKLNNSIENLEWVSSTQNSIHYQMSRGTRGVYKRIKKDGSIRWISIIGRNGKNIAFRKHLGTFKTKKDALEAYRNAFVSHYKFEPW